MYLAKYLDAIYRSFIDHFINFRSEIITSNLIDCEHRLLWNIKCI